MSNDIEKYTEDLTEIRKDRILKIRSVINNNFPEVEESLRYKMPTFDYNGNWVSVASQKNYLSVYFCSEELIKNVKEKYPKISSGKACLNIKDKDDFPLDEIEKSIIKAFNMKK